MSGQAVIAVLYEAKRKFGTFTESNRDQIARWVMRRMRDLRGESAEIVPFEPKDFDAKARAANDD